MVSFIVTTQFILSELSQGSRHRTMTETKNGRTSGLAADIEELYGVALHDRWGLALASIGWVHLAIFLVCQYLYGLGDRAEAHFLPLWGVDLGLGAAICRRFLANSQGGPTPCLLKLVARVWITFLILAFSAASLNSLVGFQTDWFKAIWATLSTFGFATMAWIFHLKFLIPAVQMSLTALLIARFPGYAYGIYGLSWCLALNGVGWSLERRRSLAGGSSREGKKRVNSTSRVVEVASRSGSLAP